MKVLVCGGRHFSNAAKLFREMDELHAELKFTALIHGGATGADSLARDWAMTKPEIERFQSKANWSDLSHPDAVIRTRADGRKYDAKAGHRRNVRMLEWEPDLVVAFKGRRGTNDMIKLAEEAGIPVRRIE